MEMGAIDGLRMLVLVVFYIVRSWVQWIIPPMKKSVVDEIVLITGAGSGIGRLMAVEFAEHGALVVLWDINKSGNEATAKLVREIGGRAHPYVCDISKRESVYDVAAKVKEEVGEVTILINNAGIVSGTKLLDTPDAKIIKTMQVNSMGHAWVSPTTAGKSVLNRARFLLRKTAQTLKSFLPDMLTNDHGHIVTISSIAGQVGAPGMADYCMSKFAIVGLHESVEKEAIVSGAKNVNFTIVNPYLIMTDMFKGAKVKYPVLFPGLKPKYVVEKIMQAVLTNRRVLIIPRSLYIYLWLKSWMPVEALLVNPEMIEMNSFIEHADGKDF